MARPRKKLDPEMITSLSAIGCTVEQIGVILKCSKDTLERRFAACIKEGRENGNKTLLKKQFELAMAGDRTMLIWLGKQRLNQHEPRQELDHRSSDGSMTPKFNIEIKRGRENS